MFLKKYKVTASLLPFMFIQTWKMYVCVLQLRLYGLISSIFNGIWTIESYLILFTNPSARVGYDTRPIFKRILTGLNSEFSFF